MGSDPQSYLAAMDEIAHRRCKAQIDERDRVIVELAECLNVAIRLVRAQEHFGMISASNCMLEKRNVMPAGAKDPQADPQTPDLAKFLTEVKTTLGDYRKGINAVMKAVKELKAAPKAARAEVLVYAAFEQLCQFRKNAWDARADSTADLYEHAIQELEKQAIKIERELALIKKLDQEGYIGAADGTCTHWAETLKRAMAMIPRRS